MTDWLWDYPERMRRWVEDEDTKLFYAQVRAELEDTIKTLRSAGTMEKVYRAQATADAFEWVLGMQNVAKRLQRDLSEGKRR